MSVHELRFAMFVLVVMVLVALGGCGPYARVQADLVAQGREGLRRVEAARQQDAAALTRFLAERRTRLDAAFDADVAAQAAQGGLQPAWVIEAGRGYAAGVEAIAAVRARQEAASAVAADNAVAADEALALLARMLRAQAAIGSFSGGTP